MASEVDARELLLLAEQYPEVKVAVMAAQEDMEQYAAMHSVAPPLEMKDRIWDAIKNDATTATTEEPNFRKTESVVAFEPKTDTGKGFRKMMTAAAGLVILISGILNYYLWNKTENANKEIASLKIEQQRMAVSNKSVQEKWDRANNMLLNPAIKSVVLAGVGNHVGENAKLLWDSNSKEVYVSLKSMPPLPAGKQYQLWAIVDGKPVDAGVYPLDAKEDMQKMKVIPQAQMFAITIEDKGGSASPTLDQMVVAGEV